MKRFLRKYTHFFLSLSLFSAFTATSLDLAFADSTCISGFDLQNGYCSATFRYADGAKSVKFPSDVGDVTVTIIGGAGGKGGIDCGL